MNAMNDLLPNTVNGHLLERVNEAIIHMERWDWFWEAVPKKIGKHAARKAFEKLSVGNQVAAAKSVKPFYEWWRKENPNATWLHPSTYLNQRRWEDEEWQESSRPKNDPNAALDMYEKWIKDGSHLCKQHISNSVVTELLRQGRVTEDQIRGVGL